LFLRRLIRDLVPASLRMNRRAQHAIARGEVELRLLPALCKSDCLSLDIGAAGGVYAFYMHRYSRAVVAFEPNPKHAAFLRRALPGVTVIQAAVSDRPGEAVLHIPQQAAFSGMASLEAGVLDDMATADVTVKLVSVDAQDFPKVGFMKIDVEGHELTALQGAARTIERDLPNLLVEAEDFRRPDAVDSVWQFLKGRGYEGYFCIPAGLQPIEAFDPAIHQRHENWQPAGNHGDRPYVNNFIFIRPEQAASLRQIVATLV
jgi:FkbM family methyltransferase